MIHAIGVDLQKGLRARKCPFPVFDPEDAPATNTWGRERIVLEHDPGGDGFAPPSSQSGNPPRRMVRLVGARLMIYAQSARLGARVHEHRERAERVLDHVLCALSEIYSKGHGRGAFVPSRGRFVDAPDLEASETPRGAVYELAFTLPRAVFDVTWAGDAKPEVEVGPDGVPIRSKTTVTGFAGAPADTGCDSTEED